MNLGAHVWHATRNNHCDMHYLHPVRLKFYSEIVAIRLVHHVFVIKRGSWSNKGERVNTHAFLSLHIHINASLA